MAQKKKVIKTKFNSLDEWKKAYIPNSITSQTLEEKFVGDPKGLGVALAMQSIRKSNKGANHEPKIS
jgi:hypothetical protein